MRQRQSSVTTDTHVPVKSIGCATAPSAAAPPGPAPRWPPPAPRCAATSDTADGDRADDREYTNMGSER